MGSLVQEGFNVRISGEDVERGTFSQRHAKLVDQENEKTYVPLQQALKSRTGRFSVNNSNLAENGPMGFEVGYSMESPKNLVLWEAQFGDFYNPA